MTFDHPADAMRAKIEDRLSCRFCKHIFKTSGEWCSKRDTDPNPGGFWSNTVCEMFEDNVTSKFREI